MSIDRVKSNNPPFDAGDEEALRVALVETLNLIYALQARVTALEQAGGGNPIDPSLIIPIEDVMSSLSVALGGKKLVAFPVDDI